MSSDKHDWLFHTLDDLSKYMENEGLDEPRGNIVLATRSLARCLGKQGYEDQAAKTLMH